MHKITITLARRGSPIFPLVLHQPVSPSVQKAMGYNVVRMHLQLKRLGVSCVWILQRGHSQGSYIPGNECFLYTHANALKDGRPCITVMDENYKCTIYF